MTRRSQTTNVLLILVLSGAFVVSTAAADGAQAINVDLHKGRQEYVRCSACHSLERNRTGPRHCGLIGRRAGTIAGYSYSKALRESGIVWNARTLDRFLTAPLAMVPGTTMGFAGIKDPTVRANLIAYLQSISAADICR